MKTSVIGFALSLLLSFHSTAGQKFRPDDPIQMDQDDLPIPRPTYRPLSKTLDLFQKTFVKPEAGSLTAQNINTLGEVPDSSWFTNRMGRRKMTIEELVTGPNLGSGPDLSAPVTIVGVKTEGVTPGLRVRDAAGQVFFFKFDTRNWPQMATSTEIIGTKFFYAFGYHTPENYLVHWKPEYEIDTDAKVSWPSGLEEKLTRRYVRHVLAEVPRRPDGTIQVLASKLLPGEPLGPFDFQDLRTDDPNDIYLHQDRRELRGYRVFCAWLNHNDSDSVNTLDMYHTDSHGNRYVKHYLIDFGTILGSGATQVHARRVGFEYYIDFPPAFKAATSLGLWERPWHKIQFRQFPSIGRIGSEKFDPATWKPDYPNPAFEKMQLQDAFWAARIVQRFSDDAIRAIVGTGQIEDPEAEAYLTSVIIERRDRILRHFFSLLAPLDNFQIASTPGLELTFENLGLRAGLTGDCTYQYQWFRFDNQTEEKTAIGSNVEVSEPRIPVPGMQDEFLLVQIVAQNSAYRAWEDPVEVFLRSGVPLPKIVGVERSAAQPAHRGK